LAGQQITEGAVKIIAKQAHFVFGCGACVVLRPGIGPPPGGERRAA